MKATLHDSAGKKKSDIDLPALFSVPIREDIVAKSFESQRFMARQEYGTYEEAGKRHSASGTISHRRHEWKGHYGKGISRIPRKSMWRRGTQFNWVGAEVANTRGGRRAHPPKPGFAFRKINKKEAELAFNIALASTFNKDFVKKHYTSLSIHPVSSVIESLPSKTKDLLSAIKNIFGDALSVAVKTKQIRSGVGKSRGRRYKTTAGLLIVIGDSEKAKFSGVDVKPLNEVSVIDLYPLGRLTLYTRKAIEELSGEKK